MKNKIFVFSVSLLALALLVSGSVSAADFRVGQDGNGNVNIESQERVNNFYAAGNLVSINGLVDKNLHAAGNVVTVNGRVGGSVYSGAGTLAINGNVSGSVHGAGGSIVVNSKIADDLIIAGGNVVIANSASVGDSLYAGAGTIDIQGPVAGDVLISGGLVTINSEIGGNVKIFSADEIQIGENAKINGSLEYKSKKEISIAEGATILGEITMNEFESRGKSRADKGALVGMVLAIVSFIALVKLLGLIIVGLILAYMFKGFAESTVSESLASFWASLGTGFLSLIVVPIVAIILMVSVVGIWLGVIVIMLYVLSIMLAASLAGLVFGSWILGMIKKNKSYLLDWKVVVLGVVLLSLISLIPVVGWLFTCVFFLMSLGAMYRIGLNKIRS